MKKLALLFLFAVGVTIVVSPEAPAQLAKYFDRSIEQRFTAVTGTAVPLGSFVDKSSLDPNAGYANMSIMGGLEYTALPLNGGIGLTASLLAHTYSVSMVPGSPSTGRYFILSLMGGPRFEMALASLTPISFYGAGQIGALYSKAPDLAFSDFTLTGGTDVSFGVSVGGGAVFDKVIDVGVRYFYTEAKFGDGRLSRDAVTRLEGIQATVGFLIF